MSRARLIVLLAAFAVMCLGVAAKFVFPLQIHLAMRNLKMRMSGVHSVRVGDYDAYLRNFCDPQDPEARGCACVALLHGLGDDATTWERLLRAPRTAWVKPVKLYALEITRNQKYTPGEPLSDYRVRTQAASIARSLAPVCPLWVLVGNSLGGWESLWVTLDQGLKVEKLILVDTGGTRAVDNPRLRELFSSPTPETMKEFLQRIYYHAPRIPPSTVAQLAKVFEGEKLGEILHAQTPEDLLDGRLGTLRLPVMVFWGAQDQLIPATVGKDIHRQIPSSVWREVPQCGHLPQRECPAALEQGIDDMLRAGDF